MRISSHSTKTTLVPFSTMLNNEWRLVMGFPLGFLPLEHLFVCLFTGILLHHATLIQENLTKKKKKTALILEKQRDSQGQLLLFPCPFITQQMLPQLPPSSIPPSLLKHGTYSSNFSARAVDFHCFLSTCQQEQLSLPLG